MPRTSSGAEAAISVLLVAPELYPWRADGVTEVVRGLSNALAEQEQVNISVVATLPPGAEPYAAGYSHRIHFHGVRRLPLPEPLYHIYLQFSYALALVRWLCRHRGGRRVVHFEILPGARAGLAAVVAVLAGLPRLVTIHGWPPNEIPLEKTYRRRMGHWVHWSLSCLLLPFFRILVVNSAYMRGLAARSLHSHQMLVIPNGTDWEYWSGGANLEDHLRAGVAWWGRVEARKSIWVLLNAAKLAASASDGCFPVYLAGNGTDLPAVRDWIAANGLQQHVVLLGELRHEQIRGLLDRVRAAVFPSPIEAFGIAVLEAMAHGRPVVVADAGGPSEFVRHNKNGLWFHNGDPKDLAAVLCHLAGSDSLTTRLGHAAQASARSFDWRQVAPQYAAVYLKVAA